jgi:glycosyltransferase involved in cell wall biosynthesis
MKILLASHTPIGGDIVVGSHHLARTYADTGHDVLHLGTPVTPFHAVLASRRDVRHRLASALRGSSLLRPRLRQLVPVGLVPGSVSRFIPGPPDPVVRATLPPLQGRLHRLGFGRVDLLLLDDPWLYGVLDLVEAETRVYRPTDLYRFTTGPRTVWLEKRILTRVHGVAATSAAVRDHVLNLADDALPTLVLENGVDVDHMSARRPPPDDYDQIPEPRFVYVGALDDRFDWDAVGAAARSLPRAHFVLIGPRAAGRRLRRLPGNVHSLGARPYSTVPAYLQHASAGLLPLGDHPANRGRSPMKLYEYLAAGIPVVARATPELERRRDPCVHLTRSRAEFRDALARISSAPPDAEACRAVAFGHDWRGIAERLLDFAIGLATREGRSSISGGSGADRL